MARVSIAEGVRYGISLLGYVVGVSIFGFLFLILGIVMMTQQSLVIGVLLTLIGSVVTYAGIAGTLFKVIADAVAKGNENAVTSPSAQKVSDSDDSGSGGATKTATKVQDTS